MKKILPEPESTVAETEAELVTQTPETEAETVSEQAQVESVSDSDTNKTIAGMPWQDLVLLIFGNRKRGIGLDYDWSVSQIPSQAEGVD